jgi:arsenate reductase
MRSRAELARGTINMTILYGISNCDTCRKAKKWFDENKIQFIFFDFRKNELTRPQIEKWVDAMGLDVLINRRGTTWRNLSEDRRETLNGSNCVDVLLDASTLMKRPIIEINEKFLIGFNPLIMEQIQLMKM